MDGHHGCPDDRARWEKNVRYLLMFYADEDAWMALPEDERNAATGRIGRWFGELAGAGRIVDGKRLAGGKRATTTVRLGRVQRSGDAPVVTDGPFVEAKESVGSYALVEVNDRDEAIAVAKTWPAGGLIEVRPVDE
jgi:hypothetical protein